MQSFKTFISEGVNDPAIFKAVFLAGGPGSGKSFIVGKTGLIGLGFKLINPDPAFEKALRDAGLSMDPEDIGSAKGQEVRAIAKALTNKQMDFAVAGRLGLVVDGTGKDYDKIADQVKMLKKIGYEVAMIFVNTDLETALARNKKRARSLPDEMVTKMWRDVQKNIGKFSNLFGAGMTIVDNSDGANYEGATMSAYRRISKWIKEKPKMPQAKAWIQSQQGKK